MTDLVVLGVVLAVAGVVAALWRSRQGRVETVGGVEAAQARARAGAPEGQPVLLLFTTPTCGTCAAAREVLQSVAAERPHLAVAEIDVASAPDVAEEHRVLRAPTVLVVGADDAVHARVSGVPDPQTLVAALPA